MRQVAVVAAALLLVASPATAQPYAARRAGDIVTLEDGRTQTTVSIVTSAGNLAYSMKIKGQEVLRFTPASIDEFRVKPTGLHGIPLLAPWANRLDEQAFYANGRRYPFDMELGNVSGAVPIHGFMTRTDQWQVIEARADGQAAWVTSRLEAFKQPSWMKQFPFAHTLEMTYRLQGGTLEVLTKITNHAAEPMPVSIGYHPYYQLTDSPRDEWTITVPARTRWPLDYRKLPTGETQSTDTFFPGGKGVLKDYNIDDVFSDLNRDGQGRATVVLKGKQQQLELIQGPLYKSLVIYAPNPAGTGIGSNIAPPPPPEVAAARAARAGGAGAPATPPAGGRGAGGRGGGGGGAGRGAVNPSVNPSGFICFEPMAGISNALNLAHKGVYKDLQSIAPGGTWQESFWVKPSGF